MGENVVLVMLIFGIIFLSGCLKQQNIPPENGFLEGKISIGPLCPVERNPPDPACQPTQETYKAWQIAVWTTGKKTKVAQLEPSLDGTYKIELPAGNYIVDLENPQHFGGRDLPTNIIINPKETTTLNINIDTGIR